MDLIFKSHDSLMNGADGDASKEQLSHLLNVGIPAERGAMEAGNFLSRAKLQHQLIGAENGIRKLSIALDTISALHNHIVELERQKDVEAKERLQLLAHANSMDLIFKDMTDANRRTVKRMDNMLGAIREQAMAMNISLGQLGLLDSGGLGNNWFERLSVCDPLDEMLRDLMDEDNKTTVKTAADARWSEYTEKLEPDEDANDFYQRCPFN